MATEQRIRTFIESELLVQGTSDDLGDDTSLIESGVIDSLGVVKIVSFLESDFGIDVRDDEILPRNFESIRAISDFVASKVAT